MKMKIKIELYGREILLEQRKIQLGQREILQDLKGKISQEMKLLIWFLLEGNMETKVEKKGMKVDYGIF